MFDERESRFTYHMWSLQNYFIKISAKNENLTMYMYKYYKIHKQNLRV